MSQTEKRFDFFATFIETTRSKDLEKQHDYGIRHIVCILSNTNVDIAEAKSIGLDKQDTRKLLAKMEASDTFGGPSAV